MLQNFVMFTAKFYVKSKVLETMYIVHIYVKSLKHIVYSKNIIRHDNFIMFAITISWQFLKWIFAVLGVSKLYETFRNI
jgi:hypothetical protein